MKRDIRIKWFYAYPVETVWECLTNPELLKQWSGLNKTTSFKAEVGFKWMETQKPRPQMKWDGKMYFEVKEIVPKKKLAYSFQGGPGNGEMTLNTMVTWTLTPKDQGTELLLEHTGFTGARNYFTSFIMELGWKNKNLKRFAQTLESISHVNK